MEPASRAPWLWELGPPAPISASFCGRSRSARTMLGSCSAPKVASPRWSIFAAGCRCLNTCPCRQWQPWGRNRELSWTQPASCSSCLSWPWRRPGHRSRTARCISWGSPSSVWSMSLFAPSSKLLVSFYIFSSQIFNSYRLLITHPYIITIITTVSFINSRSL